MSQVVRASLGVLGFAPTIPQAMGARSVVAERKAKRTGGSDASPYTSKIIKAGALLDDTKTLLSNWDSNSGVTENLDRLRRENVFGKASRSRVEDMLAVFRQRYLTGGEVTKGLVALVKGRWPAANMNRVFYFHAAGADRLLHDIVTEILAPMAAGGSTAISTAEVQKALKKWVESGLTTAKWSDNTTLRVAQGLLSTLRDFGVLEGATNKRIATVYLPVEAFAYVAFHLKRRHTSGAKLVDDPDWGLFFLDRDGVERFLFEANQRGLLEYHAAGSVTRLTFPADTAEEYANALAQRAH